MTQSNSTSSQNPESSELVTFVGRQPIFDRKMNVFAYELLFRSGLDNVFSEIDADQATSSIISDSFFSMGINAITGGRPASINFTRNVLLGEYAQLLPKEMLMVEILEDVEPDPEVIEAVRRLKDRGYIIALDDYSGDSMQDPFLEYTDIIKVDFMLTTPERRAEMVHKFKPLNLQMLAEKVETREEYEQALDLGYTLFQGFFFCKPTIVTGARIPESKVSKVQLLKLVNQSDPNLVDVEAVFRQDVALSYQILKYINSSYFGLRKEVRNLKQTLLLLGRDGLRRWASIVAFSCLGSDKPTELLVTALVRAHFCELLAGHFNLEDRKDDLFILGMFSTIDALLDMPMEQALEEITLSEEVKRALICEPNTFRDLLEVVIGYEVGDWERFGSLTTKLKLDEDSIPPIHRQALQMAEGYKTLQAGSNS